MIGHARHWDHFCKSDQHEQDLDSHEIKPHCSVSTENSVHMNVSTPSFGKYTITNKWAVHGLSRYAALSSAVEAKASDFLYVDRYEQLVV